jgi:hypothetical protein
MILISYIGLLVGLFIFLVLLNKWKPSQVIGVPVPAPAAPVPVPVPVPPARRVVIYDKSQVDHIRHYLKNVGVPGREYVEPGQVRDALQALQRKAIELGVVCSVTFAMKIGKGGHHHCTVCFLDQDFSDEMVANIEKYLANWKKHPFDIVAKGLTLFGKKKVILLEFTSAEYNQLFQATSQMGRPEGGSVVREPHVTYFDTDTGPVKDFIDSIRYQLSRSSFLHL